MKTQDRIYQLIADLEVELGQLELEAAAAGEDEALSIVAALYEQYPKLDTLTDWNERISGILEPHCRRLIDATGQTLIEAIQSLSGATHAATTAAR